MEFEQQKGVSEWNRNTKKEYQKRIGTPKRSIRIESEHQKGVSEWNWNTKKEYQNRIGTPKMEYQNGIGTPTNLGFDTSHDIFFELIFWPFFKS